jgi:hypothetical protein
VTTEHWPSMDGVSLKDQGKRWWRRRLGLELLSSDRCCFYKIGNIEARCLHRLVIESLTIVKDQQRAMSTSL